MSITTRTSVFETNSSSTHSLSLDIVEGTRRDTTLIPDDNGQVDCRMGDQRYIGYCTARKAGFLIMMSRFFNLDNRVINIIQNFTGAASVLTDSVDEQMKKCIEESINYITENPDVWENPSEHWEFFHEDGPLCYITFDSDYCWSESPEEELIKILNSGDNIRDFIFSSKNGVQALGDWDSDY